MKKIISLLFIISLSGCVQLSTQYPEDSSETISWDSHLQKIQDLQSWTLQGKLAVFLADDRQSTNIYWHQQEKNYEIQLTSFIGTRILSITKNELNTEIINNDGEKFTGKDTNSLIQILSPGLDLPVQSLQEWIKGNPINASYQLNEQQRVASLLGKDNQGGLWAVSYQQYRFSHGYYLPSKLELKKDNIRVKISISQWQLSDN